MIEKAHRYNDATVTVLLEDRHVFKCQVGDWDTDDEPMSDAEAYETARSLVMDDQICLVGTLDGRDCSTVINPKRVIAIYITSNTPEKETR